MRQLNTKHFFECSAIGGCGLDYMHDFVGVDPILTAKADALLDRVRNHMTDRTLSESNAAITSPCGGTLPGTATGHDDTPEHVRASVGLRTDAFSDVVLTYRVLCQTQEPLFFCHGDHLGSASWLTDDAGIPVQHLQYHPFGEQFVNQHTSGHKERFPFTGKERDEETGYSYFGARYIDHELMTMWLSVDPMANKYPNISPYAYCVWNPVKLVDPDGEKVDYASIRDRFFVFIERIVNKGFRERFNDLKKSNEMYIFNHNKAGNNILSTNGKELYINYSEKNMGEHSDGFTVFSVLRHETEHAVQFEHGEVGFRKNEKGDWKATYFDVYDEIKARDFESSNMIGLNPKALHNIWGGIINTFEKIVKALEEIC